MTKQVLDVGQCGADHATLRALIEGRFDAKVVQAHGAGETVAALRDGHFDLVLVNRKLDRDASDGVDIIRQIKADTELAAVPIMLVSNYAEHQEVAVGAGAEPGFGKAELDKAETQAKLRAVLGSLGER